MADISLGTVRTDNANYIEGHETAGYIINKSIFKKTIWIPGLTYNPAELNNAGVMMFPTIEKKTNGAATALCEDGVAGTVEGGFETLQITDKVSAEFHGCFNVAGIADGNFSKAMNTTKMRIMQEDYDNAIYANAIKSATESEVAEWSATDSKPGDGSAYLYLKARIREFKTLNGAEPNFGFANGDFMDAVEADFEARQTNLGDNTILNGIQSELNQFKYRKTTLIEHDQDEVLVLGNYETNFIATPKKPAQLASFMPEYDTTDLANSFNKGLISLTAVTNHMNPASVKTGVHKPFGHGVVAKITFTTSATSAPAGL